VRPIYGGTLTRFICKNLPRVLLPALLVAPSAITAQTGSVAGRIFDGASGRPVAAAEVFVAGAEVGALTQQDGAYMLSGLSAGPLTLFVRRIGYAEVSEVVTVPEGSTAVLDLRLRAEALRLDEVVVTGLPRRTARRAVGNAVSTVHVGNIVQDVAIATLQGVLSARVPGLRYTRLSGNLGTGSPLTLRGAGSFDLARTQPLVYVDGIRVNTDVAAGPPVGYGRSVNVLDDFGPEEIESVEIIQGAAAGTLYGSDAASGIIQIITRQGQQGPPEFTASIRQGVNFLSNPAGRLGAQWTCPTDPLPGPTACQVESDLLRYNMYEEANAYIRDGYFPWPTPELFRDGPSQAFGLQVRGGTPTARYFLSAGYDDEEGMVWYNTDETFRLRANVGVTFSDRFTLDLSTGYVDGFTRFMSPAPGNGGIWQDLAWSNGYHLNRITRFGSSGGCVGAGCGPAPRLGGFQEHLPTDVANVEATRDYTRFTGSAALAFASPAFAFGPVGGALRSRAVFGVDKSWDVNRNLFPLDDGVIPESLLSYCAPITCASQWGSVYVEGTTGLLNYERPLVTTTTIDWGITADLRMGQSLGLATSAGAQYYELEREFFANWGQGFTSPSSRTINQIAQSAINTVYTLVEAKSIGFYVQEEVSFADRIFLIGALRLDESSSVGEDVSARKYPKIAGAWVVSEEGFWNVDAISSLRVRGAWGKAGRPPNPFSGNSQFVALDGLADALAVRPSRVGNRGIEPEVSTELEVGFDVSGLDDRLAGSFTRHWRKNEGTILDVMVPSAFGIPGPQAQNLGRIDAWGWEAHLSARLYDGDAISVDLDLTADHIDNEIKTLTAPSAPASLGLGLPYPNQLNDDYVVSATWDPAGFAQNVFGQRVSALCDQGVSLAPDPSAPNAARYGRVVGGLAVPCTTIPNQNVVMGPAFATHTFSVAPRMSFFDDRLQVFAQAEGQYGRWRDANDKEFSHVYGNSKMARLQDDPAWVYGYAVGDDTKRSLFDADFWKLREVGLRYTLPAAFVAQIGADRASLALSGRNLWTIWQAQSDIAGAVITDPEFGAPSLDGDANFYETPPLSNISMTLRVTF
jgi:hypothetical protein